MGGWMEDLRHIAAFQWTHRFILAYNIINNDGDDDDDDDDHHHHQTYILYIMARYMDGPGAKSPRKKMVQCATMHCTRRAKLTLNPGSVTIGGLLNSFVTVYQITRIQY